MLWRDPNLLMGRVPPYIRHREDTNYHDYFWYADPKIMNRGIGYRGVVIRDPDGRNLTVSDRCRGEGGQGSLLESRVRRRRLVACRPS